MTKTKLSVVPRVLPAAELEDLGKEELAAYLRRMMAAARDLCATLPSTSSAPASLTRSRSDPVTPRRPGCCTEVVTNTGRPAGYGWPGASSIGQPSENLGHRRARRPPDERAGASTSASMSRQRVMNTSSWPHLVSASCLVQGHHLRPCSRTAAISFRFSMILLSRVTMSHPLRATSGIQSMSSSWSW